MKTTTERKRRIPWIGIIILLVIIVAVSLFLLGATIRTVSAGYKGVKTEWGRIVGTVDEGIHFITPIAQDIVMMNVQIQKVQASESTASADLQEVTTTIAVNYRLKAGFVQEIWETLRHDYEDRVIVPNIEECIKATTALYQAESLISDREHVKMTFLDILKARLDPFHIDILQVQIVDFQFSEQFTSAIEAKVTAEQRALEAKNKLEQIKYEAQQLIIQAEAQKNATIRTAEGEAQARIISAQAEAEAIRLVMEQFNMTREQYLLYLALLEWDGKLPYFYGSDAPLPFITIPTTPDE